MNNKESEWKGYTLEELRFQRMLAMAKAEIGKSYVMGQMNGLTSGKLVKSPMLSRVAGALTYVDYAVLAFRMVRSITRVFKK